MFLLRATIVIILVVILPLVATTGRQQVSVVDGSYPYSNSNNKTMTILNVGYLTAIKGDLKDRQGLAISGAIQMALEEINNDPKILPNVQLDLWWNDTRGELNH